MNNFVKAFLSFGLATSIEKLLGFIILPIYTRYFSVAEYGIIDMIGTILAVAIIFGGLQLETSLQRYYYEFNVIKKKLLISNIYILVCTLSIAVGLIIFCFANTLSIWLFSTENYSLPIKMVSIQIPIQNISMLGLVLLRFEKKNFQFLIVILTKVISSLGFVYLFVVYLKLGLVGVFLAQLLALSSSTLLVTYYNRRSFVFRINKNLIKRLFSYSLPQFPARMGSMSLGQANRFFMLSFLSIQAIGIYSVSLKLASIIQLINTAFIMAWAPFMHELFKKENNKAVFASVLPLVCGITFLSVSLISLYSMEMIKLIASPDYFEAHHYIGGLSLFFALYIIKEVVDIGPKITERTKYLSYNFFISVFVNVVSLFVFINLLKLPGVIIAMMLTNLCLVSVSWFTSNKLYYISFSITKFVLNILPAILICFVSLFYSIDLMVRIGLSILFIIYYGLFLLKSYKEFKLHI